MKNRKQEYSEKLKDPRWQKMRLQILERDKWTCQKCWDKDNTLHVHHRFYNYGDEPWEHPPISLVTLCEDCHAEETKEIKEAQEFFLKCAKSKFFAQDLQSLMIGFDKMELQHVSGVVASSIQLALEEENIQRLLIEIYFFHLMVKRNGHDEQKDDYEKRLINLIGDIINKPYID